MYGASATKFVAAAATAAEAHTYIFYRTTTVFIQALKGTRETLINSIYVDWRKNDRPPSHTEQIPETMKMLFLCTNKQTNKQSNALSLSTPCIYSGSSSARRRIYLVSNFRFVFPSARNNGIVAASRQFRGVNLPTAKTGEETIQIKRVNLSWEKDTIEIFCNIVFLFFLLFFLFGKRQSILALLRIESVIIIIVEWSGRRSTNINLTLCCLR